MRSACGQCRWLSMSRRSCGADGELREQFFCDHVSRTEPVWLGLRPVRDKECLVQDLLEDDFFAEAAAAEADDSVPEVKVDAAFVPDHWSHHGKRVAVDAESQKWVWVSLLTVPDESRVEMPAIVPEEQAVRVDLSTLPKMSAAEVKKLVTPTLPDYQLVALADSERSREKPRKVALDAIVLELNRRGSAVCGHCGHDLPSVDRWIAETAADPWRCRIAAAAVAVGADEPECRVVGPGDETEAGVLAWIYQQILPLGQRRDPWATYGAVSAVDILRVRAIALDVANRQPTWIRWDLDYPVDVNAQAAAFGLRVKHVASPATVYHAVRECQWRAVQQMAVDKLEAERLCCLAWRSVV